MDDSLGVKIKKYRKRAGFSQLDLELDSYASPGSISRIEAGKINPTKETLYKIADALKLDSTETADLFGIEINKYSEALKILKILNKITEQENIELLIQQTIDELSSKLGYRHIFIMLLSEEHDILQGKFANYSEISTNTIETTFGFDFKELKVDVDKNKEGMFIKSILNREIYEFTDFKFTATEERLVRNAEIIQRKTNLQAAIVFPLYFRDISLGCIFFAKDYTSSYKNEKELLEAIIKQISIALMNLVLINKMNNGG